MMVRTSRNQDKPADIESRRSFYEWLANTIKMDGIESIKRDIAFDDSKYRSGGIRCHYRNSIASIPGLMHLRQIFSHADWRQVDKPIVESIIQTFTKRNLKASVMSCMP
jgi:hypothetical protein